MQPVPSNQGGIEDAVGRKISKQLAASCAISRECFAREMSRVRTVPTMLCLWKDVDYTYYGGTHGRSGSSVKLEAEVTQAVIACGSHRLLLW